MENNHYIPKFLFISVTDLSHIFLWGFRCFFMHVLQLDFVSVFVDLIALSCIPTENVMHVHSLVHDGAELRSFS